MRKGLASCEARDAETSGQCGQGCQTLSNTAAIPCPPPMHIVTSA